ncbi:hypothetical protein [Ferruginibacter sp.]|nr:hypothetical protein [Ferruginibacter sp.]
MTINLALEFITRRMRELGYSDNYSIQLRHFILPAKSKQKIHAQNQLFVLIEPPETIFVKSDTGVFDVTTDNINELQYEHKGEIRIRNYSAITQHARFIQVIPNENETCP